MHGRLQVPERRSLWNRLTRESPKPIARQAAPPPGPSRRKPEAGSLAERFQLPFTRVGCQTLLLRRNTF